MIRQDIKEYLFIFVAFSFSISESLVRFATDLLCSNAHNECIHCGSNLCLIARARFRSFQNDCVNHQILLGNRLIVAIDGCGTNDIVRTNEHLRLQCESIL